MAVLADFIMIRQRYQEALEGANRAKEMVRLPYVCPVLHVPAILLKQPPSPDVWVLSRDISRVEQFSPLAAVDASHCEPTCGKISSPIFEVGAVSHVAVEPPVDPRKVITASKQDQATLHSSRCFEVKPCVYMAGAAI